MPTNCSIWFHLIDLDMLYLQTHDVHLACWFFICFVESSLLLHVLLHFFDVMFFWFLLSTLNLITTAAHPSHGKNRTFQEAFCWEGPNNDLEINTRTMLGMQINRFVMSRKWRHCDLQSWGEKHDLLHVCSLQFCNLPCQKMFIGVCRVETWPHFPQLL